MPDALTQYRQANAPLPTTTLGWPLYGAGLAALGKGGAPVGYPVPEYGPDELLVRHDAAGLCFSDLKQVQMGAQHPRLLGRQLMIDPVLPGHEAALTVLAVGANLRDQYRPGQRFAVQPDIWWRGQSTPYGYRLPGAFQQYNVLGGPVLAGDGGCNLIPIPASMGYAAAALTEPWACVEASYRMTYRTQFKPGGAACFIGGQDSRWGYHLDALWDGDHPPSRVVCAGVPHDLAGRLQRLAGESGVEIAERGVDEVLSQGNAWDDIVTLDCDAARINLAAAALANAGILAIISGSRPAGTVELDLGRLHYDDIFCCGSTGLNLDDAYRRTPARTELMPGGVTWIIGAGGPMGRMHLQRCLEGASRPSLVLATDVSAERVAHLRASFEELARTQGVDLRALNPASEGAALSLALADSEQRGGIHDALIMAPGAELIAGILPYLAPGAVVNLFAGLKRGATVPIDPWLICGPQQVRFIGHSGSALADQVAIVERAVAGHLAPERSVAAVGGLRQVGDGMRAMADAAFPGKIVIYPMAPDFPLTALSDLRAVLPAAYERLGVGGSWTFAAEEAFLSALLPG
jgi:threonine dehydrogenase-like Zn-dependent dehydrogenase